MATIGGAVTCTRDEAAESLRAERGETGEGLMVIQTDVTDEASVRHAVAEVREQLGAVAVLAHLVGAWHGGQSVHELPLEERRRMVDLNLTSAFVCSRAVLLRPRLSRPGRTEREPVRGLPAFNTMVHSDVDPLTGAERDSVLISDTKRDRLGLAEGARRLPRRYEVPTFEPGYLPRSARRAA